MKETHALLRATAPGVDVRRQRRGPRHHDRRRRRRRHRRLHRQRRPQDPRGRRCERRHGAARRRSARRRTASRTPTRCCPRCCRSTTTLDPDTYGGAMLLGVDGVCIISHGSSSSKAIVNAIELAGEMVDAGWSTSSAGQRSALRRLERLSPARVATVDQLGSLDCCRHLQEATRARRDPRRAGSARPQRGLRARPRPSRRHPRDRSLDHQRGRTRSPTTSTPTRWP